MRKLAIRYPLMAIGLAIGTALVAFPAINPAQAKTPGQHMHHIKHHKHWRHHDRRAWYGAPAEPRVGFYSQPGPICPQVGHSFDCKIWPPPYEDDPDRKTSKY